MNKNFIVERMKSKEEEKQRKRMSERYTSIYVYYHCVAKQAVEFQWKWLLLGSSLSSSFNVGGR